MTSRLWKGRGGALLLTVGAEAVFSSLAWQAALLPGLALLFLAALALAEPRPEPARTRR